MKRPTAPVAARMTARDISVARAKHAARIAERAAAVRRRQALAGTLLVVSLVVFVIGMTTSLATAWALVPAAGLIGVLEAGRRVAASYRRADLQARKSIALLERRLRSLEAATPDAATSGGSASQDIAPTQAGAEAMDSEPMADEGHRPDAAPDAAPSVAPIRNAGRSGEPGVTAVKASRDRVGVSTVESATVVRAREIPEAIVADVQWDPMTIPAPSYTLKATAPRAPIAPDADMFPSGGQHARVPMRPVRASMLNAKSIEDVEGVAPVAPAIDIDSALARRRVSGE